MAHESLLAGEEHTVNAAERDQVAKRVTEERAVMTLARNARRLGWTPQDLLGVLESLGLVDAAARVQAKRKAEG